MAWVDRGAASDLVPRSTNGDNVQDILSGVGRMRVYEAGKTLFGQGQACQGIFIIQSGLVGLRRSDEDGNSALVSLVFPGDIAGYRALLSEDVHSNTSEVLTASRILFIERAQMKQLIDRNAMVREHIVSRALADLNRSQAKCAALLTEGLRSRFIRLLLALNEAKAQSMGEPSFEVQLPIQRKDIAALIGAAPASLSRLISELEDEGLIHVDGRKVEFSAAARAFGHGEFRNMAPGSAGHVQVLAILMDARRALLSMIDAQDPRVRDALNERVQAASAQLDGVLTRLSQSGSQAAAAVRFQRVWENFKKTRQSQIIPAIYAGRLDQARKIATGIQAERLAMMKSIMTQNSAGTA